MVRDREGEQAAATRPGPRGARLLAGDRGEALARAFLERAGAVVVAQNWRARPTVDGVRGELDLVAVVDGVVVGVEVKARSSTAYGHPLESIDRRKLDRLHRLLAAWARRQGLERMPRRIDAVAILPAPSGRGAGSTPSGPGTGPGSSTVGRVRIEHRRGLI
ncbi:YraN family protein [Kocuria palustris]|uniref:YraN family protein n=1 Tax=Kocuria palustris TaxID=71999 RepID=UPI0011A344DA|nr:YraN family protein [Kocuria palustris]